MDPGLLERCLRDDPVAWQALADHLRPCVVRVLARALARVDRAAIEDLEQETWLRLLAQDRAQLRQAAAMSVAAVERLATTIALNLVRDHCRKIAVRKAIPVDTLVPLFARESPGPESLVTRAERLARSRPTAEDLAGSTDPQRDLLIWTAYYEDGATPREIAALELGISLKGIESVIHRLTQKVRKRANPTGDVG